MDFDYDGLWSAHQHAPQRAPDRPRRPHLLRVFAQDRDVPGAAGVLVDRGARVVRIAADVAQHPYRRQLSSRLLRVRGAVDDLRVRDAAHGHQRDERSILLPRRRRGEPLRRQQLLRHSRAAARRRCRFHGRVRQRRNGELGRHGPRFQCVAEHLGIDGGRRHAHDHERKRPAGVRGGERRCGDLDVQREHRHVHNTARGCDGLRQSRAIRRPRRRRGDRLRILALCSDPMPRSPSLRRRPSSSNRCSR